MITEDTKIILAKIKDYLASYIDPLEATIRVIDHKNSLEVITKKITQSYIVTVTDKAVTLESSKAYPGCGKYGVKISIPLSSPDFMDQIKQAIKTVRTVGARKNRKAAKKYLKNKRRERAPSDDIPNDDGGTVDKINNKLRRLQHKARLKTYRHGINKGARLE